MMKIFGLLVVTILLVVGETTSTSSTPKTYQNNETATTTSPFTLVSTTDNLLLNESLTTPEIIVEVATPLSDAKDGDKNDKRDDVQWLDLTDIGQELDEALPNSTKIETNAAADDAPMMAPRESEEGDDDEDQVIKPLPIDNVEFPQDDDEGYGGDYGAANSTVLTVTTSGALLENSTTTATTNSTSELDYDTDSDSDFEVEVEVNSSNVTETTSSSSSSSSSEKPTTKSYDPSDHRNDIILDEELDGVVLPTDSWQNMNVSINATSDAGATPLSVWNYSQHFVDQFAHENPKSSITFLSIIFAILILLAFLVIRECCKRRDRQYRQNRLTSITADLYDTSACSHRYSKITLPDNREVTMQLMSADNTAEIV